MSYSYSFIFNNNDLDFNEQIKNLLYFLSFNKVKNYYFDGNLYSKKPIHFKNASYDDSNKYKNYVLKIVEDFIKINNQSKKTYKNYERITSLEMLPVLNEDNKDNLFFIKEWSEIIINNFDDEERKKYHKNIENYKKLFLHDDYLNILSNEDIKMVEKLFETKIITENIKENLIDSDNKNVEPSSFCFIGNSNSCFEVINMLVSLSEHHKNAKVYGLVDEKMREELKNNQYIELNFNLIDIKEIEQEEKIHNKFTIIKKTLLECGDTLFIEEDIFILKKITLPYSSDINIGFSSHHINNYKEIIKGMFWCNNINCLYDIDEIYNSNISLTILFNNLINKYSYNEFVIGDNFITWDVNDEINSKKVLDNNISLYDMAFPTENIMNKYNKQLFWQYPAITEKTFYIQNKDNNNLFSMPWATIIDKEYNLHNIYRLLRPIIIKNKPYFTCCQHIHFGKLIPLWKALNIVTVFTPHKIKNKNNIKGITIKSCPLYAVNVENEQFNKEFNNIDFLNNERQILYSFIGGYQPNEYLTKIRPSIFEMKHPENTVIKYTGEWHFNKLVYNEKQNHKLELNINEKHTTLTSYYNNLLINSRYTLAPSGSGPNSIRFWEALAVGSIPVLLSDTLDLPEHELWKDAIVIIKEDEVNKLQEVLNNISPEKEKIMRENCIKIYNHFKNNFANKKIIVDKNNTILNNFNNNNFDTFTIDLPTEYIKNYYKCFGHFITDHLFMLFKFKHYLKTKNINIENLNLNCSETHIKPFMIQLYKALFKNVTFNRKINSNNIYLGIVLGSIENTETKKIYLAKSSYYSNIIPKNLYTNIRRVNEDNKFYSILFREHILNYFNIEKQEPFGVLIINRLSNGRKWENLNLLTDKLKDLKISYSVKELEKYSIREQIEMVYNSKYIIFPSGSSQGHLFWVRPKETMCIECFIPGHRYINTILYGINLEINWITLFDIFNIDNISNINNKNIRDLLIYQKTAKQELISTTILETEIKKEIWWFELFLLPELTQYYCRQYTENIDIKLKLNKIIDLIK